ncbi:tail fibers protein [Escherichia phage vB_EcoM_ESCO45]|uniref:Tail fibers protein n=1 Tax=Escherichia phage vB_EcoM_ESCO45 TaxID=2918869 RepID=A0AAE9KUX4_9CAUD|nr:tail fibers protein [Escherichia phage vB_EcoM_ESCO45]
MADYKLSELNSIDTIRSDDLLHVRVKKRPEMLGDEDRRMTYQDFLASFKLERFVQIAGSTMTGDLGIVKLLYGGKAVFDPTGSSEITIGDVLKTFKINANGLKLTIADASRSATVYHTLNKPSPNELGMRTNEENDARYARLAVTNTFSGTQNILSDNEALIFKNTTQGMPLYIRGQDADGTNRWYLGNDNRNTDNLVLKNVKSGAYVAILANLISVNKSIQITGQVQPSDFSNLDARYFTQTVANQRFAQLTADNTFSGSNTFNQLNVFKKDGEVIRLQNANAAQPLYIKAIDSTGANRWYIGNNNGGDNVALENYKTSGKITVGTSVDINKTLTVTGQVQPSDWANIDSRYIPAATLSNLAKLSDVNTFRSAQVINQNGSLLRLKNTTQDNELYIAGHNADNARRWYIGSGERDNPTRLIIHNDRTLTTIYMQDDFLLNKTVRITGQVQPSDWSNLDARYFTQAAANQRFMVAGSTGEATEQNADGVAWNAKTGLYNVTSTNADYTALVFQMYQGVNSSTACAQLKFQYKNGGMWYRTSVDSKGFEAKWSKIYTEAQKPTPSELGAYTKAETDQKIAQAVSDSTDLNKIYPVGIVTWFNSNVDPNTALPGLTWTYLNNGVGRTIRIAAANGSDVATTGGSDSVTLAVGNLPSHTHSFSATTSSFDYGTKNTNTTGAHTHTVSGSAASAGNHNHAISWIGQNSTHYSGGGGGKIGTGPGYTDSAGAHTHTISGTAASNGNHAHSVGIGAHTHTVSGNTGGTGSGSAFSVTNQFYKLMAWVRTA